MPTALFSSTVSVPTMVRRLHPSIRRSPRVSQRRIAFSAQPLWTSSTCKEHLDRCALYIQRSQLVMGSHLHGSNVVRPHAEPDATQVGRSRLLVATRSSPGRSTPRADVALKYSPITRSLWLEI